MKNDIPKAYSPNVIEEEIYKFWQTKSYEHSEINDKTPFVIVIPPPNITGALHMGHALNNTLQDVIIRYARMVGFNALWIPGTDHGGIATQNVLERMLLKEGKTRSDIGREKFLEYMWQWREKTGDTILHQLRRLGCSCDWQRTRFTMDEVCSAAVNKAFIYLYNEGYIYRGVRIVNWCPRCNTAISDIEVEYKQEKSFLWYIKYPLIDDPMCVTNINYIIVATTRPETMLGDAAVAVNPEDERYKKMIDKKLMLPLMNREIKIIADNLVDKEFGSGAVKVTPAHDVVDFQIGERHNLKKYKVIDEKGKMIDVGKYSGLDRFEARKQVVKDLESLGLIEKVEEYCHNIGICYRCNTVIEPLISNQWFLRVKEIAQKAIESIERGEVVYYPESWKQHTLTWLQNIKDWCISRQIWWGHRIPIWYCKNSIKDKHILDSEADLTEDLCKPVASVEKPDKCLQCGQSEFLQDEDVLDTWFSSALWPFSVFGWGIIEENIQKSRLNLQVGVKPEIKKQSNDEIKYYYPTRVLVTGYEILYLWVARMIMMGLKFLNKVPFSEVFIHGIVRDLHGKKMSKSLGNVIDPLDVIARYGTDALRFSLVLSSSAGKDIHLSEESFSAARNFINKLYNMTRFVLMNLQKEKEYSLKIIEENKNILMVSDEWILYELNQVIGKTKKNYEKYMLGTMARELYDFIWYKFCDWYIETAKINFLFSQKQKEVTMSVLIFIIETITKMLHPIAPYFTEYIWQTFRDIFGEKKESVTISSFPTEIDFVLNEEKVLTFILLKNIVTEIRSLRNNLRIGQQIKPNIVIRTNQNLMEKIVPYQSYIEKLAFVENISFSNERPKYCVGSIVDSPFSESSLQLFILLEGVIEIDKERVRLNKELEELNKYLTMLKQKLEDKNFITKAAGEEVEKTQDKYKATQEKINKINEMMRQIF